MRLWKAVWVALFALTCGAQLWAQAAPAPTNTAKPATTPPKSGAAATGTGGGSGAAPPATSAPAGGTPAGATTTSGGTTTPSATGTATTPSTTPAAAAPSQPTTSAPRTTAATGTENDGSTYVVRLRDLEQRIDELKEQIRRSHTRLSLLSETILSGGIGGARAEITFKNEMSDAFRLTRVLVVLDGAVQYNKQDDTGALASQAQIPIFSGAVPPGDHSVQVRVELRGHGYGVFSYLRGYRFTVPSTHSFTVTEGKSIQLEVVLFEKGGVTTPIEQRPAVRYVEKLKTSGPGEASPAAGAPASSRASGSAGFSVGTGGK